MWRVKFAAGSIYKPLPAPDGRDSGIKLVATSAKQIGMFPGHLAIVSAHIVAWYLHHDAGQIREIAVLKLIGTTTGRFQDDSAAGHGAWFHWFHGPAADRCRCLGAIFPKVRPAQSRRRDSMDSLQIMVICAQPSTLAIHCPLTC